MKKNKHTDRNHFLRPSSLILALCMVLGLNIQAYAITPEELGVEGYNAIDVSIIDQNHNDYEPYKENVELVDITPFGNLLRDVYYDTITADKVYKIRSTDKIYITNTGNEDFFHDIAVYIKPYILVKEDKNIKYVTRDTVDLADLHYDYVNLQNKYVNDKSFYQTKWMTNSADSKSEYTFQIASELRFVNGESWAGMYSDPRYVRVRWAEDTGVNYAEYKGGDTIYKFVGSGETFCISPLKLNYEPDEIIYGLHCEKYYMIDGVEYKFWKIVYYTIDDNYTPKVIGQDNTEVVETNIPKNTVEPFIDVFDSDYYADAVKWAYDENITKGTSDNTFSPERYCNRGQVVTFLYRLAGSPKVDHSQDRFIDVKESDYFYDAVTWAMEKGITYGTGTNLFSPYDPCSESQILTFIYRANGSPEPTFTEWSMTQPIGFWSEALDWADYNKMIPEEIKDSFQIGSPCPRSHIVYYLYYSV